MAKTLLGKQKAFLTKNTVYFAQKGLFHKEQSFETGLALGVRFYQSWKNERSVTWDVRWVAWHTLTLVLGCPPLLSEALEGGSDH